MYRTKTIQFSVYLDPTLLEKVEQLAYQNQRSTSWMLAKLVGYGYQLAQQKGWAR